MLSEGSVWQSRDLTNRNRIQRRSRSDELANGSEVHIHQGPGAVDPAGVRRRLSDLPREAWSAVRARTGGVERQPERGPGVSRGHSSLSGRWG